MDNKICIVCNIEKSLDNYYNKYRECKQCNIKRSMKRYNENKGKLSNQRKLYYEKNREMLLAKSRIYQQNKISYTQQIKDLKNKIEELTQTVEMLNLKIE